MLLFPFFQGTLIDVDFLTGFFENIEISSKLRVLCILVGGMYVCCKKIIKCKICTGRAYRFGGNLFQLQFEIFAFT